jgi:hypothetical protein
MSVLNHLLERHLDTTLHQVWVAEDLGCATFPLYNLSGQLLGYQRYRPGASKALNNDPRDGRYFTRLVNGNYAVWGLEAWSLSNTLFVTEGIFDAARLTARGYSAIATFSNDVSPSLARWLWLTRQYRPVVAVCDNDAAGRKLAKFGNEFHVIEESKDMGEASDEYVTNFLKDYK